ncbi:hypothetical protein GPL21_33155 [Bradyrhizobium pachyrhizi]|uniref:Uncharacterized protein n=1 Tax=Bradyrhizobium pachyrhizi TaxID=280333 RepID=A0A844SSI0_9BRAD|nr:hypothetical protein [Bradyrhizobium pachyrhizi]MVT69938.1 hypothetical protein [Bradyrhizobium pachyrhizi]
MEATPLVGVQPACDNALIKNVLLRHKVLDAPRQALSVSEIHLENSRLVQAKSAALMLFDDQIVGEFVKLEVRLAGTVLRGDERILLAVAIVDHTANIDNKDAPHPTARRELVLASGPFAPDDIVDLWRCVRIV